jgi:hypothetical protein
MYRRLKRREVIALLSGAATWPLAVWAQQTERIRRLGVLIGSAVVGADDDDGKARVDAFLQALHKAARKCPIFLMLRPTIWQGFFDMASRRQLIGGRISGHYGMLARLPRLSLP